MEEFNAEDYYDEISKEVEEHFEVGDNDYYLGNHMRGTDDTKPYCVIDNFCSGIENEKGDAVFTEAAFWLDCFYRYEKGGREDMVQKFISNSKAETYEELIDECDETDFSFDDYFWDFIRNDGGYHFLVKDALLALTDDSKQRAEYEKKVEESIEKYKDRMEVDFHLKDVVETLYDEDDKEWIYEIYEE